MFYLRYLREELTRRGARTFLAVLALAVGVALVIDVAALGAALHTGQTRILDPLGGLGSDLLVTTSAQSSTASSSEAGNEMTFHSLATRQVLYRDRIRVCREP